MRLPDRIYSGTVEFHVSGHGNPVRISMILTNNLTQRRHELHCSGHFETNSGWAYKGQILKNIRDLSDDPTYQTAMSLWERYHDNVMHVGTPRQEELIRETEAAMGRTLGMKERRKLLKRNGLLYDKDHDGFDYMYGTGFTCHDIPWDDVQKIRNLIERKEIYVDGFAVHEADLGPQGRGPAATIQERSN
ncbi:MAG: hypothetical protein HDQ88_08240 [Clostridia bacterium]|nr:hypothetical protein [Clostridia bacterium]